MTIDTSITDSTVTPAPVPGNDNADDSAIDTENKPFSLNGIGSDKAQALEMLMIKRSIDFSGLASDRLSVTHDKLKEFKLIDTMMGKMRRSQSYAGGHGHASKMDPDVVAFCKKYNVKVDTKDHDDYHTHTEWDYNIAECKGLRDKCNDDLRVLLLKLKSVINNLDSSVSGASSTEDKENHIAKKLVNNW